MWIKLPSAALLALVTAARGFPWHGAVAGTLGLYLLSAGWALTARGTRGFMWVVQETSWWAPAAGLFTAALLTGVPALRRNLLGSGTWKEARRLSPQAAPTSLLSEAPAWSQAVVEGGTSARPAAWDAATERVIAGGRAPSGAELLSDHSTLEKRNTGPLGRAIKALDACLASLPAISPLPTTLTGDSALREAPLSAKQWRQLLSLESAHSEALTLSDRAELVTRAASHSLAAGSALAWRWLSGLEETLQALGTDSQKRSLLPLLGAKDQKKGEIVAAGWTGRERSPSRAIVVSEKQDGKMVLGLRVTCDLENIVGADAATVIALDVLTYDPEEHISLPRGADGSIGVTCVLVRPSDGRAPLKGANIDQRLASHSLTGPLRSAEVFVALDDVVGGLDGIGAAGEAYARCAHTWETVRVSALASGIAQKIAANQGSVTIIRNVMRAETVEAWSHASLGAATSSLNALGVSAALIAEERSISSREASALQAAVQRSGLELIERGRSAHDGSGDDSTGPEAFAPRSLEEAFLLTLRPVSDGAATDGAFLAAVEGSWSQASDWTPAWAQASTAAVRAEAHAAFDIARCEGWRRLFQAGASAALESLPGRSLLALKRDPEQRPAGEVLMRASRGKLVRAYSAARTAALLAETSAKPGSTALGAVFAHLQRTEERLATIAFLELAHRAEGSQPIEGDIVRFNVLSELSEAHDALASAVRCLPGSFAKMACGAALRAAKSGVSGPGAQLAEAVASSLVANPEVLRRLLARSFAGDADHFGTAPLREAALLASASRVPIAAIQRAQSVGQLPPEEFTSVLDLAVQRRIISSVDSAKIQACMSASHEILSGPALEIASSRMRHSA